MISDLSGFLLLAQEDGQGNQFLMWFPLILVFLVMWFILIRPQRQEQKRREEMLSSLKKNDRVVTIGGIIGTVANLSADGKEVTLKVDDNTRLKFLRSSIQNILRDEADEAETKSS